MDNNQLNGQTPETPETPETPKAPKKAKEKMVKIRLPITREERAPVPVWVNERSWVIQRGQEVEVPECVAEVLRNRDMMLEYGIAYDDEHQAREQK